LAFVLSTFVFNDCILNIDGTNVTSNGSFTLTFNNLTASTADITEVFNGLTLTFDGNTSSIDGDISVLLSLSGDVYTQTLTSNSLTISFNGESITYTNVTDSLRFDEANRTYTVSFNGTIRGTEIGGPYTIETSPPFQGSLSSSLSSSSYPTVGKLTITAPDDGSFVSLNADTGDPNTVLITIRDAGGTVTSEEIAWNDL
jgi:hypothetical protein